MGGRQPGAVNGGGIPLLAHRTFVEKMARSVNFFNEGARVRFSAKNLGAKVVLFRGIAKLFCLKFLLGHRCATWRVGRVAVAIEGGIGGSIAPIAFSTSKAAKLLVKKVRSTH